MTLPPPDELIKQLAAAGWIRQPSHTDPDAGITDERLTHPGLGLELVFATFDDDYLAFAVQRPKVQPSGLSPMWSVGIGGGLPLTVILAAADACADTSDPRGVFECLAAAGWSLTDQTLKGSKAIYQRWSSPDGERCVWWSRYGRSQAFPGSWSVTWPGHGPGCPSANTALDAPPAVICAFALTT